jgi:hypothetical protein
MRYIHRDADGKVSGHYANEQPYAREAVEDDHPDIKKYYADIKAVSAAAKAEAAKHDPIKLLEARIAKLEKLLKEKK